MGTRGTTGFIINGERKSSYQQYDSYLDGVGVVVLSFARKLATDPALLTRVRELAEALKVVPEDGTPTADDLALIGDTYHENVSSGSDWYSYLRQTQGSPALILDSGYITGTQSFLQEEYDYILDLDEEKLTVYASGEQIADLPFSAPPDDAAFIALGEDDE